MNKAILAAGLAAVSMGAAHAQNAPTLVTTQTFVTACQNASSPSDQSFCHGFAQGVYDTYVMSRHPKRNPEFICFKDQRLTRQQALSDFLTWTGKNPQFAEKSAADTILRYLAGTYPCKS